VVAALTSNGVGTCGADDNQAQAGHLITTILGGGVTHSLTSEGHDASEDGTGRGTPIITVNSLTTSMQRYDDNMVGGGHLIVDNEPAEVSSAMGFHMTQDPISSDEQVPCIGSKLVGNGVMVTPLALRGREHGAQLEIGKTDGPGNALRAGDGGSSRQSLIAVKQHAETIVRRLTELECERLQGYPDGWTDGQSGSARYRQLGNSVAVPVVEWIATRLVDWHTANESGATG
jgi:DNA (cytosine-5)-methyltransferase 1